MEHGKTKNTGQFDQDSFEQKMFSVNMVPRKWCVQEFSTTCVGIILMVAMVTLFCTVILW